MFETSFSYKSATPLPSSVALKDALRVLHDFERVNKLNPDVRGCKPIPPPKNAVKTSTSSTDTVAPLASDVKLGEIQYFEVEDSLPFIPAKLWSGGVRYQADFIPLEKGCDITVHAPGGFTSVNHWRLVHDETKSEGVPTEHEDNGESHLTRITTRDLMHTNTDGTGWYVQIISDAKCSRTFAGFVKGFLKNSHAQLQSALIDRCVDMRNTSAPTSRPRRPTIGRRKSSAF